MRKSELLEIKKAAHMSRLLSLAEGQSLTVTIEVRASFLGVVVWISSTPVWVVLAVVSGSMRRQIQKGRVVDG